MKPLDHTPSLSRYVPYVEPARSGSVQRVTASIRRHASHLATAVLNGLSSSQAPRIRQKIDRLGNRYYRVYDPIENTHRLFTSEESVRVWLEQRYYQ